MRSKLLIRTASAIAAIAIIAGSYWYLGHIGLLVISMILTTLAVFETGRLVLPAGTHKGRLLQNLFVALGCLNLSSVVFFPDLALAVTSVVVILFLASSFFIYWSEMSDLNNLLKIQSTATLGLLYSAVLPSFALRLLSYPSGEYWFFTYLGIVFAGDTFAYFSGTLFGRRKLLPVISPKKTIEGAIGGIVGSAIAGAAAYAIWLQHVNPVILILVAMITGVFAQIGDLFESLLKRVVQVKDSGQIMPGHGGLLDRLDGIYFAAPLFFVALHFLV